MKLEPQHPQRWDLAPYEAQQLQAELQARVVVDDAFGEVGIIAGVEVAHSRFNEVITVAVAAVRYPGYALIERHLVEHRTKFPFIPELLSFRETPAIIEALGLLSVRPDLLIIDGPGVAHPRGLGVASHVGVVLDIPTVGCAKGPSVGSFVEPEVNAGSSSALVWQGEIIGTVFRSKNRVAPLFVSTGHRVSRQAAARFIQESCQGYRFPEPTRLAGNLLVENRQQARSLARA